MKELHVVRVVTKLISNFEDCEKNVALGMTNCSLYERVEKLNSSIDRHRALQKKIDFPLEPEVQKHKQLIQTLVHCFSEALKERVLEMHDLIFDILSDGCKKFGMKASNIFVVNSRV